MVEKGSQEDIVNATIQRSYLWQHIEVLHLHENMQLSCHNADCDFAEMLLDIGHGQGVSEDGNINLPEEMIAASANDLIDFIYPDVGTNPPPPHDYFLNQMILAPRNSDVCNINERAFKFSCQQFPVHLAFALTINKAQGHAVAILANPHVAKPGSKTIMFDVQIYVGPNDDNILLGALRYFNLNNDSFPLETNLYQIHTTFSCCEASAEISSSGHALSDDDFVGDIHWLIPLGPPGPRYLPESSESTLSSEMDDCEDIYVDSESQGENQPNNGPKLTEEKEQPSFTIEPCKQAIVHIAGVATDCQKEAATFKINVEHIPNSPKYKHSGKPMPFNNCYVVVVTPSSPSAVPSRNSSAKTSAGKALFSYNKPLQPKNRFPTPDTPTPSDSHKRPRIDNDPEREAPSPSASSSST
ncbi:hypothetical protein NLJ89_g8846 [Agrocybe chaxingu]|uniref:ATP-dependent DNA helicase n=1 Tax=Agrocybe chaxingu TaxID=84603 RepID=A0A9W8JUN3_9AGAR|nr:hypothetical protein NLJ89_g8846 [Agrocybe chaxingu]